MKNIIFLVSILFILTSCSNDDVNDTNSLNGNFFPDNMDNSWTYKYSMNNKGDTTQGEATAKINSSETINQIEYKVLDNCNELIGIMDKLYFRRSEQQLIIKPQININYGNMQFATLDEIKLIGNATPGNIMSDVKNTFKEEPMQIPDNQYDLNGTVEPSLNLRATSTFVNKFNEINILNTTYKDIYKTKVDLYIALEVVLDIMINSESIPLTHKLIDEQKYGSIDIWFAKDKGIVKTEYNYSFKDLEVNSTIQIVPGISLNLNDFVPELNGIKDMVNLKGMGELKTLKIIAN